MRHYNLCWNWGIRTWMLLITISLGSVSPALAQGPTWTQKFPTTSPPARYAHEIAYDTARSQVVLFGGVDPSTNTTFNDTRVWDGTNWTQKFPATSPPPRVAHAMAYDAARGQVVLFGGFVNGGPSAETWVWDGVNWTQKFPATSPPVSVFVGMTYDAIRQQVVLFGGGVYPNVLAETWVWDGVNWTQKFPATSPPARIDHQLAFDAARGKVLLFGSWNGVTSFDDTWTWDGSNWTQQFPSTSPPSRFSYGIVYDVEVQQIVLFGGEHCDDSNCGSQPGSPPASRFNDTWTWDGTTWTQQFPTTSPPATALPAMGYDEARSQIVLFGGVRFNDTFSGDTWVWGTSFAAQVQPPINADASSVFNSKRGVVPVKFTLTVGGTTTCDLPPAVISLFRTGGATPGMITEGDYVMPADNGSNFRVSGCQYVYNLRTRLLGVGTYQVNISIGGTRVGTATFGLD